MISLTTLIKEAFKSEHFQKHSTIVLKGGAPISIGHNCNFRHSEVVALTKVHPASRIAGCTLINLRIRRSGAVGLAYPCPDCINFLIACKVAKVHYTMNDGSVGVLKL